MKQRAALAATALLFGALAWSLPQQTFAAGPLLSEYKLIDLPQGHVFDNLEHLEGAIDLNGASSVQVNSLRGVWGLSATSPFRGALIDASYIDKVHVGLHWQLEGARDLVAVTKASQAPQFGQSTVGAIKIFSKAGSDTLDPVTQNRLDFISPPQKLLMDSAAETAQFSLLAGGSSLAFYSMKNDALTRVAGIGDAIPNRPGSTFTHLVPQRGESDKFMFYGGTGPFGVSTEGLADVYRYGRDTGATVPILGIDPVTNPYGAIYGVAFDDGRLAVGTDVGLLLTDQEGNAPANIVPSFSSYGSGKSISIVREMRIAGERIAFTSIVAGRPAGFVANLDGSFTKIADIETPLPGGTGTFGAVVQMGISDELIIFVGFDAFFAQAGLFGYADDALFRIVGPGDVKDGKTVLTVDFMPDAIDHNVFAYTAFFTDGSSAAYLVAVVPEPAQWLLLAAGLVLILGYTSARRRTRAA